MHELKVRLVTYDLATGELELDRIVDHNKREDRQWMGRHCWWAFRNGKKVETFPVDHPVSEMLIVNNPSTYATKGRHLKVMMVNFVTDMVPGAFHHPRDLMTWICGNSYVHSVEYQQSKSQTGDDNAQTAPLHSDH